MHVSLLVLLLAAVLIASGIYMLLERTLSRIIMGAVLAGNGINLLFLLAIGTPGTPPFEGSGAVEGMSDPLPMAMVLTAIVISLALTGFGMALSYRSWQLFGHDEVPDDVEDLRIADRSRRLVERHRHEHIERVGFEADEQREERERARMQEEAEKARARSQDDLSDDISDDFTSDEDVEYSLTESDTDDEEETS
ncbi:Na(+)/H(+) antiporter subunit C [Dermabacter vaginalis]|uniref:Na(+)/H(+) antiporter subunit C n=1 Tax=Dermabacter vaginalis TaxID=1630135 RepID=UPI000928C785|nr:Na(+)/H(+) antiporter subunit C [Dermabacter vaginalis]MCT2150961.1 Na(+)/H(+) antiporter subunit C [Dermabacter vaginalis]SHY02276.1 monovalent cation/H+ antiporter subunit C [Mycobacteroides abscessus subsp. abscessus]